MLTMVIVTRFLHFAETKFFILVNVWSETLSKFPNENVSQNLALNIVYNVRTILLQQRYKKLL